MIQKVSVTSGTLLSAACRLGWCMGLSCIWVRCAWTCSPDPTSLLLHAWAGNRSTYPTQRRVRDRTYENRECSPRGGTNRLRNGPYQGWTVLSVKTFTPAPCRALPLGTDTMCGC